MKNFIKAHTKLWIGCIVGGIAVIGIMLFVVPQFVEQPDVTPTPTIAPTNTQAPTVTIEPTTEPTSEPTVNPTNTITPTEIPVVTVEPTVEPTKAPTNTPIVTPTFTPVPTPTLSPTPSPTPFIPPTPVPTNTPTPTPSPTPTNTPTPTVTNTPTPSPTNTPTPTPTVVPSTLRANVQMGDNVYFKYYDDGTLVVTGTGSTWDFANNDDMLNVFSKNSGIDKTSLVKNNYLMKETTVIIINEGVTRIGDCVFITNYQNTTDVYLPSSLKSVGKYGFYRVGYIYKNTTWHNLNLDKLTFMDTSFGKTNALDGYTKEEIEKVQVTPTPTPSPTVTPTPNPAKPREIFVVKGSSEIVMTYIDNGTLVVTGTGTLNECLNFTRYCQRNNIPLTSEVLKHLVIEEGFTDLYEMCLDYTHYSGLPVLFETITLPKSLTKVYNRKDHSSYGAGGQYCGCIKVGGKLIAYDKNGNKFQFTVTKLPSEKHYGAIVHEIFNWLNDGTYSQYGTLKWID